MDNDEGFQSEPEIILIDAQVNRENDNINNEGEEFEENDENEAPTNEQENQNDDDEVTLLYSKYLWFHFSRRQVALFA